MKLLSASAAHRVTWMTLALSLAACATLGLDRLQPLRFSEVAERPSTVRLLAPDASRPAGGLALRLWTRVENPNPVGLTLSEIDGRFHLEGREGPRATFPLGLPLEAEGDTVVPLDVTVGFEEIPDLAGALRTALARGALDYRLEGSFTLDAGAFGQPRFGPATLLRGELEVIR